jgi:hypothetical protein
MLESPANRRKFLSGALITAAALSLPARSVTAKEAGAPHVVLLGDSILDNGAYVGDGPDVVHQLRERFVTDYRAMLDDVQSRGLPVAVCTIYDARFPDAKQRRVASVGLTIFNECITREASARGLALIDLRLVCRADEDLADPIEPRLLPSMIGAGAARRCLPR